MQKSLSFTEVRKLCEPDIFNTGEKTGHASINHDNVIIGQERAIKALKLGLGMKAPGFNIYVSGASGTGKLTAVTNFVEAQAKNDKIPFDWCYVNNFKDTYRPHKLFLPPGQAVVFKKEMKSLVEDVFHALVKVFESEEYAEKKGKIVNAFEDFQEDVLRTISEYAEQESFMIKQTTTSILTIPLKDKKPLTEKQISQMSEPELDKINAAQTKLQEKLDTGLREIRKKEKEMVQAVDKLTKEVAGAAIGHLIDELNEKYRELRQVIEYLALVKEDILENLPDFMKSQKSSSPAENPFQKRYEVTVLVDNRDLEGAPVIIERNPTYNNLTGRVEKESFMGTLITDFTMIRQGSLHNANGGYLIIRIDELLQNYFSWECLKRALKNREISIEEATDQLGYLTTKTLKPEPIPLNAKVILIGNSHLYRLLYNYDSDFRELFKIKADFNTVMDLSDDNVHSYTEFIRVITEKENLLNIENTAFAKIIEYSSRLAENQEKLSTKFGIISDILREADHYARQENATAIAAKHITKAVEEKSNRSNLIQEKITEMIANGQILIDIRGSEIGQINGLSVLDFGDITFGVPSRITCTVSPGKSGVIDIEREAELSGPIHTKGVLILSGFLMNKFMQDKPPSLSARLVFEQSYSGVEGDSASSTELYAILSSLSGVPIKQGIAVTGSVNQKGEIQPIGGVNEKIEGYYEICKALGLNGEQGVLIPASNIKNLMLKEEVVDAIKEDKFKIWTANNIEEGIEVLTGVKAGSIWEDGTIINMVNNTLNIFAARIKEFAAEYEQLESIN